MAARYGKVEKVTIYRYRVDKKLEDQLYHLVKQEGNKYHTSKIGKFVDLYLPSAIHGLIFDHAYELEASRFNTSLLSNILSLIFNRFFSNYYTRYQGWNSFVYDQTEIGKFNVLKLFDYNLLVFDDQTFLINFDLSVTHIYLGNINYAKLKNFLQSNALDFTASIFITHKISGKRTKIVDPSKSRLRENNIMDYHISFPNDMMEHYFKDVQNQIFKMAMNYTDPFLMKVNDFANQLSSINGIKWTDHSLQKITLRKVTPKGILVGNNFQCNKLQAAYHNGIYKPVDNKTIIFIKIGETDDSIEIMINL